MASYREQIEASMIQMVREFLDSAEAHNNGELPQVDVYGVIGAISYTPEEERPDPDEAFSRTSISFRLSDTRHWAQVGILRSALMVAEAGEED